MHDQAFVRKSAEKPIQQKYFNCSKHAAILAYPYETHITAAGKTHTLFPRIVSAKTVLF